MYIALGHRLAEWFGLDSPPLPIFAQARLAAWEKLGCKAWYDSQGPNWVSSERPFFIASSFED